MKKFICERCGEEVGDFETIYNLNDYGIGWVCEGCLRELIEDGKLKGVELEDYEDIDSLIDDLNIITEVAGVFIEDDYYDYLDNESESIREEKYFN